MMKRRSPRYSPRSIATVSIVFSVALALAGCVDPSPGDPIPESPPEPNPSPSVEPDHRALFDETNRRTLERNPDARGRDFVDALVAAGFDKSAMEVSADETNEGRTADSIFRWAFKAYASGEVHRERRGADQATPGREVKTPASATGAGPCLSSRLA